MSIGLIGKKLGMTRVFDKESGDMTPVTVIDVADQSWVQIKTAEKDGYNAVQVGYDEKKEFRVNKPALGHFKKHGSSAKYRVEEFRVDSADELPKEGEAHPGIELLSEGQWVDVIGTSKGKGFQGVVKRHNFSGSNMTHGSMMHRRPGAVGPGSTPGRVFKNQPMPGRTGGERITTQNLRIVAVRPEDNVILVSGTVPGAKGSYVRVRPAKKKTAPNKD
jgi:large subunit ribosomal protein L3